MKNKRTMTFVLLGICAALCITALVLVLAGGGEKPEGNNDESSLYETETKVPAAEAGDIEIDISDLW